MDWELITSITVLLLAMIVGGAWALSEEWGRNRR